MASIIQADSVDIGSLFKTGCFLIPSYQRLYEWEAKHVVQLLDDLHAHLPSWTGKPSYEQLPYTLNTIQVIGEPSQLEVIDGQQRLTTLFLVIAAIRDHAKDLGGGVTVLTGNWETILQGMLAETLPDRLQPRIVDQYPGGDANRLMYEIAAGKEPAERNRDLGGFPLARAYHACRAWLRVTYPIEKREELVQFVELLHSGTQVLQVRYAKATVAWRAFERANDRGKKLAVSDLVKSDLFNLAKTDDERQVAGSQWEAVLQVLWDSKISVDTFLHHWVLADLARTKVGRNDIRGLIQGKARTVGAPALAEILASAAQAYGRILRGRVPATGSMCVPLTDMAYVPALRRSRQVLPLLLAARSLDDTHFSSVAADAERLALAFALIEERGQSYERQLFELASTTRVAINDPAQGGAKAAQKVSSGAAALLSLGDRPGSYPRSPTERQRGIAGKRDDSVSTGSPRNGTSGDSQWREATTLRRNIRRQRTRGTRASAVTTH